MGKAHWSKLDKVNPELMGRFEAARTAMDKGRSSVEGSSLRLEQAAQAIPDAARSDRPAQRQALLQVAAIEKANADKFSSVVAAYIEILFACLVDQRKVLRDELHLVNEQLETYKVQLKEADDQISRTERRAAGIGGAYEAEVKVLTADLTSHREAVYREAVPCERAQKRLVNEIEWLESVAARYAIAERGPLQPLTQDVAKASLDQRATWAVAGRIRGKAVSEELCPVV